MIRIADLIFLACMTADAVLVFALTMIASQ